MQTTPLLKLSIAGGSPPRTSISIQVYKTGETIVLKENGWPILKNTEEAGVYKFTLSIEKIKYLQENLEHAQESDESYGKKLPGSIRYTLKTADKTIQWSDFAKLPNSLENLKTLLLKIIQNSTSYKFQTLNASCKIEAGKATVSLKNTGKLPITFNIPKDTLLRKRVFLIATTATDSVSSIDQLPEIYNSGIPFGADLSQKTITIQPNDNLLLKNHVQFDSRKNYYIIMETEWQTNDYINKKTFPLLVTKATSK